MAYFRMYGAHALFMQQGKAKSILFPGTCQASNRAQSLIQKHSEELAQDKSACESPSPVHRAKCPPPLVFRGMAAGEATR